MYPKLVICIPTYNRSTIIDEVLSSELQMLKQHSIDVVLYDSSEGQETERVYRSYRKSGFDNLFFRKIASNIVSNRKIYMIWQEMEHSEYDYVWLIHDHRICTKTAVKYILNALQEKKDFYVLDTLGKETFENIDLLSSNDFFHKGAGLLTLYGASIISTKSFIAGTDWHKLERKYLRKKDLNFSQLGFYFDRANQIEDFRASLLHFSKGAFIYLPIVGQEGGWYNDAIRIWTKCWASTILKLPVRYNSKREVIRNNEAIHLSRNKLIEYRRNGVFNWKIFFKYIKWIYIASSQSLLQYFLIAIDKAEYAQKVHDIRFVRKIKKEHKKNRKTVIYGAGKYALKCAKLMVENNVGFDAFIVSTTKDNVDYLLGYPVLSAAEYFDIEDDVFVIISVKSGAYRKEIAVYLEGIHRRVKYMYFEQW